MHGPRGHVPDGLASAYPVGMEHRVTLADVARTAGVSLATASRAFNGSTKRTVGAALRERVLAAAADLNYAPDGIAQAMARGHTASLGLVVHDITDPYFSAIAAGVTAAARRARLAVTLATTDFDPAREAALVDLLQGQRVRAIVLAGGRLTDEDGNAELRGALAHYVALGGQVAAIGQPTLGVNTVVVANHDAASDLARALHGYGYRRFAVLAGLQGQLTANDRRDGFLSGLRSCGVMVDPGAIITCAFTRDGGYDGVNRLIEAGTDAEVVFAVNDVMAVGAMAGIRDLGMVVPRDMAVAGFDDIATLRDVTPGLSTIHIPLVAMGSTATDLALSAPGASPRLVTIKGTVILRGSTPRLPIGS